MVRHLDYNELTPTQPFVSCRGGCSSKTPSEVLNWRPDEKVDDIEPVGECRSHPHGQQAQSHTNCFYKPPADC